VIVDGDGRVTVGGADGGVVAARAVFAVFAVFAVLTVLFVSFVASVMIGSVPPHA
jgi:hypothetical protein